MGLVSGGNGRRGEEGDGDGDGVLKGEEEREWMMTAGPFPLVSLVVVGFFCRRMLLLMILSNFEMRSVSVGRGFACGSCGLEGDEGVGDFRIVHASEMAVWPTERKARSFVPYVIGRGRGRGGRRGGREEGGGIGGIIVAIVVGGKCMCKCKCAWWETNPGGEKSHESS